MIEKLSLTKLQEFLIANPTSTSEIIAKQFDIASNNVSRYTTSAGFTIANIGNIKCYVQLPAEMVKPVTEKVEESWTENQKIRYLIEREYHNPSICLRLNVSHTEVEKTRQMMKQEPKHEYNNNKGVYEEIGDKFPDNPVYDYKTCKCFMCVFLRERVVTNMSMNPPQGDDKWISNFAGLRPVTLFMPTYFIRHIEELYGVHKTGHSKDDLDHLIAIVALDTSAYLAGYRYDHIKKMLDKKRSRSSYKSEKVAMNIAQIPFDDEEPKE